MTNAECRMPNCGMDTERGPVLCVVRAPPYATPKYPKQHLSDTTMLDKPPENSHDATERASIERVSAMIKSILVCTDGSDHSNAAADYGIHLAQRLEARLLGLHVLDSRMLDGPLLADISGWIGAQPYGAQVQQFQELLKQRGEAIIAAFNDRCKTAGMPVDSIIRSGHPPTVILEEEGRAELLILGQRGEHAGLLGEMTGSNVERVVRHSSNPCLVTPGEFKPISRILAAYDGSGHASQALQEATELAQSLGIELTILTVEEEGDKDRAEQIAKDAKELVEAHDCKAETLVTQGKSAAVILEIAHQKKCDLIVVGAYGHSRIREMVLGSTTHQIINRARVPVMLVR